MIGSENEQGRHLNPPSQAFLSETEIVTLPPPLQTKYATKDSMKDSTKDATKDATKDVTKDTNSKKTLKLIKHKLSSASASVSAKNGSGTSSSCSIANTEDLKIESDDEIDFENSIKFSRDDGVHRNLFGQFLNAMSPKTYASYRSQYV
jgi:hypothetical protein